MISGLLERGIDVFTIMRQSGHSSPSIVEAYDRRPERAQRAASELVYCPVVAARPTGGSELETKLLE
jgi:hypothetical protein